MAQITDDFFALWKRDREASRKEDSFEQYTSVTWKERSAEVPNSDNGMVIKNAWQK